MPSGEMRRPPQPWESKLARLTSIIGGAGVKSSGDGTTGVAPTPTPGTGGGTEPAPVLPPPALFTKPSTPVLIGGVQGINVLWDGLNSSGDIWPYDTSWMNVHVSSEGTAFSPTMANFKGILRRPGLLFVGGLSAGTAYYVKFVGDDQQNNKTVASDAATGYTGLTTASDYGVASIGTASVSFDARAIGGVTTSVGTATPANPREGDIWLDTAGGATTHKRYNGAAWDTQAWGTASLSANSVTAVQIAAGAVTAGAIAADAITGKTIAGGTITGSYIAGGTMVAGYLSGGTISGGYVTGGTVNAGFISGGTVDGSRYQTGAFASNRIVMGEVGVTDAIQFLKASSSNGFLMNHAASGDKLSWTTTHSAGTVETGSTLSLDLQGPLLVESSTNGRAFRVNSSGEVFSYGIDDNTTASAANVRVGTSAQLLRSTSSVRRKTDLAPIDDDLTGVSDDKLSNEPANVNPYDVLNLTPTEFQSLAAADADARAFGFIAEDVAAKFPWACDWDDTGQPDSVQDRPIIAALVQVVKDLTARIEALEGN